MLIQKIKIITFWLNKDEKNFFIYGGLYKTATEFLAQNYLEKLDKDKYEVFTFYKGSNQIFYHTFLKIIYSNMSLDHGKIISDFVSNIKTQYNNSMCWFLCSQT